MFAVIYYHTQGFKNITVICTSGMKYVVAYLPANVNNNITTQNSKQKQANIQ